jgi:hypothetical protein
MQLHVRQVVQNIYSSITLLSLSLITERFVLIDHHGYAYDFMILDYLVRNKWGQYEFLRSNYNRVSLLSVHSIK